MTEHRHEQITSVIFGKIALHALTILQITPSGCQNVPGYPFAFPDYSSVFMLIRAVMDGYCTLYYMAIEDISEDERNFRIQLGDYHAIKKRIDFLNALGLTPEELPQLEKGAASLKSAIENNICLPQNKRNRILNGKEPLLLTNTEICAKVGIAEKYYKPHYDYLSSYTHGHPISLEQILALSNIEDVLALMTPFLHLCSGYLCFSIRDFINIFPDQNVFVNSIVRQRIKYYEELFASKF